MENICFECKDEIRARQQKLQCNSCGVHVHRICSFMSQARYREILRDSEQESLKCNICDPAGAIKLKRAVTQSPGVQSAVPTSTEMQSVVSPSVTVQSSPSTSTGVHSTAVASIRIQDPATTSTIVLSTAVTSTDVHSTTVAATRIQNAATTTTVVPSTAVTSTDVYSTAVAATRIQNAATTSTVVLSTAVTSTDVYSTAVAATRIQNAATTSTVVPSTIVTSTDVYSTAVAATRIQNAATTSTVVPSTAVTSTDVHSTAVASTRIQNAATTFTVVPSTAVTSTDVHSTAVAATRIQNAATTSTVVPSTAVTSTDVYSTAVASTRIQNAATTSTVVLSTAVTSTDVYSTAVAATRVQNAATTSTVVPSTAVTSTDVDVPDNKTPFMKKIEDIFTATIVGQAPRVSKELHFKLTAHQANLIARASCSNGTNDVKVFLRLFKVKDSTEEEVYLPCDDLLIFINHLQHHNLLIDDIFKKKKEPVEITNALNLSISENKMRVCLYTSETYRITVEMVKQMGINELEDLMVVSAPGLTEDLIREKFKTDDDCEVATTSLKASLVCPIGKMRLVKPCRSRHCTHIQCIDAKTVLSMNRNRPSWKCQICQEPAEWNDLYIDGLFLDILKAVPWNVVEVELQSDGSWKSKNAFSQKSTAENTDKENTCILLDETIDKFDVIDLTESDDEGTPVPKVPLKTNNALMNKITTVKNLFEKVTSHIEKLTETNHNTVEKHTSSYGCHRNSRNHYRQARPYERYRTNNGGHNSYRSNHPSDNYRQTTLNWHGWSNTNNGQFNSGHNYYNSNYLQSSVSHRIFGNYRPVW